MDERLHQAIRAAMRRVIDDDGRVWLMPTAESTRLAEDPEKHAAKVERLRALQEAKRGEAAERKRDLDDLRARRDERVKPAGYQARLF